MPFTPYTPNQHGVFTSQQGHFTPYNSSGSSSGGVTAPPVRQDYADQQSYNDAHNFWRQQGSQALGQTLGENIQTPRQGITQNYPGAGVDRAIGNFVVGAAKGAGHTVSGIQSAGQKGLETITGIKGNTPTIEQKYGENLKPSNTAQKVGFGTEQVGEFFVPGGAAGKAEKAIEGASLLEKAPSLIKSAAPVVGKALTEGTTMAGISALQGADKNQTEASGAIGAGLSVATHGVSKLLDQIPETAWSSILKRTPTMVAKNPDLPAQAAESGLTGLSRESISAKAGQQIQNVEVKLDDLLSNSNGKIAPLKIAPYLDELRSAYSKIPGEQGSLDAIDNVARDFLSQKSLTPLQANEMKRAIYQNISNSYGKGILDIPAKSDAQKAIARGLKNEIEKVIPEAKSLNEKQAVYIQMKKALDKAVARGEGKGIAGTGVGLYDLGVGGLAQLAGMASGHPTTLAGVGAVIGSHAVQSPAVLSGVSKLAKYFDTLSPTKKLLFYHGIQGLSSQTVRGGRQK